MSLSSLFFSMPSHLFHSSSPFQRLALIIILPAPLSFPFISSFLHFFYTFYLALQLLQSSLFFLSPFFPLILINLIIPLLPFFFPLNFHIPPLSFLFYLPSPFFPLFPYFYLHSPSVFPPLPLFLTLSRQQEQWVLAFHRLKGPSGRYERRGHAHPLCQFYLKFNSSH